MKRAFAFAAVGLMFAAAPLSAQPRGGAGGEVVQPDDQHELQWAAGVSKITELPLARPDAHLFGITGGDPAMNGVQTYISFFESPADGHKIFMIGDFLDFTIVSQAANRVVLSVHENYMHGRGNSTIGARYRRLTITWRSARDDVPRTISIASTPGR